MTDARAELRQRALRLLMRREHARLELRRKLAPHAESAELLDAVLDELVQSGWLSEVRFVESMIYQRAGRFGRARIRQDLQQRGVPAQQCSEALALLKDSELDRARAVWQQKFGHPPADVREAARQMRFLLGRGFAAEVVRRVVPKVEVSSPP
jgi:regulatory protein